MSSHKRVVIFSKYSSSGASSRVRSYQLQRYANQNYNIYKVNIIVTALFGCEYVKSLYARTQIKFFPLIISLARRMRDFIICWIRRDGIIVEKEFFPWIPFLDELFFLLNGKRITIDIDDAVYENYQKSKVALIRSYFDFKFRFIFKRAHLVTCGSQKLMRDAVFFGANSVYFLPTTVSADLRIKGSRSTTKKRVVWIGSPSTERYLASIALAASVISNELDVTFIAIGANDPPKPFVRKTWVEANELEEISLCDVGIMPLPDLPFERGKCAYKLVQYMACAVPFVASPVGENIVVAEHGAGLLAETHDEWVTALRLMLTDSALREVLSKRGRTVYQQHYASDAVFSRYMRERVCCA